MPGDLPPTLLTVAEDPAPLQVASRRLYAEWH